MAGAGACGFVHGRNPVFYRLGADKERGLRVTDEQKYERELGGINEKLAYLLKGQDDIFSRLNELTAHGCARGAQNAKDIDELRNAPTKAITVGAAAIAAILSWVHRS